MRLVPLNVLPLGLAVFLAACPCSSSSPGGRPSRVTRLDGSLRDSATATASPVLVNLSETQADPYPRSLDVDIEDPVFGTRSPFAGHILHLRLLDPQLQTIQEIVVDPPVPAAARSILTRTVIFQTDAEHARYDAIRDLFLKGGIILELETDLPGRERTRVPLRLAEATGWVKSSCD